MHTLGTIIAAVLTVWFVGGTIYTLTRKRDERDGGA